MKRFLLIPLVFICFFSVFKNADAQYLPFSAKDGLVAARKAVGDSGYNDAYLVSILTKWSYGEGTMELDSAQNQFIWNGLDYTWEYIFYQTESGIFKNIQVMRNQDSSFTTSDEGMPEFEIDTTRIPDDNWIDPDKNIDIKRYAMSGEWVWLRYYTNTNDSWGPINQWIWHFAYYLSENAYGTFAVNAYTGEVTQWPVIGSVQSKNPDNLLAYPNPSNSAVIISGENIGFQFKTINIFTASGQKIATIPCSSESTVQTIPAHTFPANGLYFLKLSGRYKSAILPVTIQGR